MGPIKVAALLIVLLAYIAALIFAVKKKTDYNEAISLMAEAVDRESKSFVFNYELKILNKFHIKPENAKTILFVERAAIVAIIAFSLYSLKGLAMLLFGAITVTVLFDDLYKKDLYRSGILSVNHVNNFLNHFVPRLSSGNSADQSFLDYINYTNDIELAEFYDNKENPDFKIMPHIQQIVEIYQIAKYNEDQGFGDYLYILHELSSDISQKQTYYNNFIARIGEIKPICWSYYAGVPALILVSYDQTYTFWQGGGGWIMGLVLLGLFSLFKFLIYKLQKKTITAIF